MFNTSGQALTEYVMALSVLIVFLAAFAAPQSPLNLLNAFKAYQNGIVRVINSPVP